MWGVCLDSKAIQEGLFQTVIQYKIKENGEVIIGIICGVYWHFKLNCYFYKIKVNGRVKSKRYYDNDLNPAV